MKPSVLASSATLFFAAACAPDGPRPVAPPSVLIARPAAEEPPSPDSAPRPAVRLVAAPGADWIMALRDARHYQGTSRTLTVTKIQALESLFSATQPTSPDRPAILRRLAEMYVELAVSAGGDHAGEKVARAAHAAAMKYFDLIHNQYPTWCSGPNASDPQRSVGCDDEVLYHFALQGERAGQLDMARKAYLTLLQSHPGSRHVPAAYLAFGEMFLEEATSDPTKLALAEQAYAETVKYPPPDNRVYGLARYRLALVYAKQGDDLRALKELVYAAEWAKGALEGSRLAAEVRKAAVVVYARAGDPAQARTYFSHIASGEDLEQMLADLEKRRAAP